MTAKRRTASTSARKQSQANASPATATRSREIDAAAFVAAALCIVAGYLSGGALSPDGVSYLDLAAAMQRGDWSRFVQGYWSPLLPFVIGAIGLATGMTGPDLVYVVHALNTVAAVAALALIWRWGRRDRPALFGRAALSALLLCSFGLPRLESVTPDVILLAVAVWLSYELLAHGGRRWHVTGVLLGVAFLAKTSTWPLLILVVPLRLWAAHDAASRRRVLWSTAICVATMSLWIVPMSVKAGRATLGSSGRLNFSWYLLGDPSALPDRDAGRNRAYEDVAIGDGRQLTLATFDDAAHWTYQPWGDPTAWAEMALSRTSRTPSPVLVLRYLSRQVMQTLGLWLMPLLVAVLIPVYLLHRRDVTWRALVTGQRDAMVLMALGLAGVLQFIVVHSEPRLIAPFAWMLSIGWIHWCATEPAPQLWIRAPALRACLGWLGAVAAIGLAMPRLTEGARTSRRLDAAVEQIRNLKDLLDSAEHSSPMIAVVGPAAPMMSDAYRIEARIAAQIPPRSAALLSTLPRQRQAELLTSMFRGKVALVWQRMSDGRVQVWRVPPSRP